MSTVGEGNFEISEGKETRKIRNLSLRRR